MRMRPRQARAWLRENFSVAVRQYHIYMIDKGHTIRLVPRVPKVGFWEVPYKMLLDKAAEVIPESICERTTVSLYIRLPNETSV